MNLEASRVNQRVGLNVSDGQVDGWVDGDRQVRGICRPLNPLNAAEETLELQAIDQRIWEAVVDVQGANR